MKVQAERRRVLRRFFVFLLALFCTSFPAGAAEILRVTLPESVNLEGEACALSDVARLEGPDELTRRLGALLLSVQDGVITREQVIDALKVSGVGGVRVELKMPAFVTVNGVTTNGMGAAASGPGDTAPVPAGQSGETLAALIKNLAAWDGEVEARHRGAVPEGRLVSPASVVPGTPSVTLKFRDEAGRERSLAVRLTWTQSALVLLRSIKKGEVLKESDFTLRSLRVNRAGVYASRFAEVAGFSLRRNLSQGEALPLDALAGVTAIERGKSVMIVARDAGLVIQAKGEALENGALGDIIRVRNAASKAVLTAVVVANDTVEVEMP